MTGNSSNRKFRINFCNICGLKANINEIFSHLQFESPQILALSETQVFNDVDSSQFNCQGYNFIYSFFPHRGVGIYIRSDVPFTRHSELEYFSEARFSFIWISFRVRKSIIYFCFLYRSSELSHELTADYFDRLSSSIDSIYSRSPGAEIVFAGDFNIHNRNWLPFSHNVDLPGIYTELFAGVNSLSQLVSLPTFIPRRVDFNSSLLDLFLTSDPSKYSVQVLAPLGNSDHALVSSSFAIDSISSSNSYPNSSSSRIVWNFKEAHWEDMNRYFFTFNWSLCLVRDANLSAELISKIIVSAMHRFIPYSLKKVGPRPLNWFSVTSRQAIQSKNIAYNRFISNASSSSRESYVSARNLCKSVVAREKFRFDQKIREKILCSSKGSRDFWNIIGSISRNFRSSSIPVLIDSRGCPIVDPLEKANLLASKFASNSSLDDSNFNPPSSRRPSCNMGSIFFRERAVLKVLLGLNIHKSAGPDGIPPIVLKSCARSLCRPLRNLYYLSFSTGIFPRSWKIANVQPVPKKGKSSDPSNYRPISITSILSKVMEKIVNRKILSYLESNNLLDDRQYGFRPRRSTGDLMTYLSHEIGRSIHSSGEAQVLSLDIAKAFDRVSHKGLLAKLECCGVPQSIMGWIRSFLEGRNIRVVLDGSQSDPFPILSGVPQGSVLSPTLFLVFINDLLSSTLNPIHSFADDSTLHCSYELNRTNTLTQILSARASLVSSLNDDLDRIHSWGLANLVEFNASKTQGCLFSRKNSPFHPSLVFDGALLKNSSSLVSLGMTLSEDLSWYKHILVLAKKAASRIGFLRRCQKYLSSESLGLVYKAFIRPILEYNSHVWSGALASSKYFVDRIQKRAIKIINNREITDVLDSLEHRRNVGCLALFYRYFHRKCSLEITRIMPSVASLSVSHYRTRNVVSAHPFQVRLEFCRTDQFKNSFIPRTSRLWNLLPSRVFPDSYDIQVFKTNVHNFFRTNPLHITPGQAYPIV